MMREQAKEKSFMDNRKYSMDIMEERMKIRNSIIQSKKEQMQEKQL